MRMQRERDRGRGHEFGTGGMFDGILAGPFGAY